MTQSTHPHPEPLPEEELLVTMLDRSKYNKAPISVRDMLLGVYSDGAQDGLSVAAGKHPFGSRADSPRFRQPDGSSMTRYGISIDEYVDNSVLADTDTDANATTSPPEKTKG